MSEHRRRLRRCVPLLGFVVFGHALSGCLYDADKPCGDGLVLYGEGDRCVCPAGSVLTATGCHACGEHEVAAVTACQCETGFARASDAEICEEVPEGLGVACDPLAPACAEPFTHCEPSGDAGYCTSAPCETNEDCAGGYACSPNFICQNPFAGGGT